MMKHIILLSCITLTLNGMPTPELGDLIANPQQYSRYTKETLPDYDTFVGVERSDHTYTIGRLDYPFRSSKGRNKQRPTSPIEYRLAVGNSLYKNDILPEHILNITSLISKKIDKS